MKTPQLTGWKAGAAKRAAAAQQRKLTRARWAAARAEKRQLKKGGAVA